MSSRWAPTRAQQDECDFTACLKRKTFVLPLVHFLPEVRESIKDTRPKTNTTRARGPAQTRPVQVVGDDGIPRICCQLKKRRFRRQASGEARSADRSRNISRAPSWRLLLGSRQGPEGDNSFRWWRANDIKLLCYRIDNEPESVRLDGRLDHQ